jgi:DHA1 family tetracycline resistance protein-like MFS transporter
LPILWNNTAASTINVRPSAIDIFVVLLALSGVFSSTFTLVFAYISDTVRQRDERVSAYGLALATFGLSFTIGPMAGGYLSQASTHYVFICSFLLTVLDLLYIYFILPESRNLEGQETVNLSSGMSILSMDQHRLSWSPLETMRLIAIDPFLRRVGEVAFLYYTGLWAVISTLSLYAVKRFHMGPERLGELMSALGLCTMVAEAVLVRILVPLLGEKRSMRLGLAAFSIQCIVLGLAYEGWHLFVCAAISMLGNLVFPSLSSLVSGSVEPEAVGEALGAVNGIKALTEGIGPLVFGSLMTLSEGSALPGWPYLLAALLVWAAYKVSEHLPDAEDDDYIHEKERKHGSSKSNNGIILQYLGRPRVTRHDQEITNLLDEDTIDDEDDDGPLLSEIDESEDEPTKADDLSRLPVTFASLMKLPPTTLLTPEKR